jgi:uncharacterized membrane protein
MTPVEAASVPAQTSDIFLDPVEIAAVMNSDGLTTVSVKAQMKNLGSSSVTQLNFRIDSLAIELTSARVNQTPAEASLVQHDRYTEAVVGSDPLKYNGDFTFYLRPITTLANLTFTAKLPDGALLSEESLAPIYPESDMNYTDGTSLSFVWTTPLLQPGQERVFIIRYQTPNYVSGAVTSFLLESIVIALLGIIAGIGLAVGGPRLLSRLRRVGKIRFIGVTSEEEEILEVIRRKGGSCPQKDLYTEFEMSQAKVSLLLNNLEERGLVRRFREGRENVVHIMED